MTLLSRDPFFIFVHIPKTGGSSLTAALRNPSCLAHGLGTHASFCQAVAAHPAFAAAPVYAVFRNPWARLWSLYNFALNSAIERIEARKRGEPVKTKHDARQDKRDVEEMLRLGFSTWVMAGRTNNGHNTRCQLDFVKSPQLIPLRFESLAEEAGELLGLDLPRINPTVYISRDYRPQYSPAARHFVAEVYGPDIERFGYRF